MPIVDAQTSEKRCLALIPNSMMIPMASKHSILQQVLCLLLCMSAWRGPVPMVHHHDALTDPVLLEQHQHTYHAQCCDCCDEGLTGIHWHFGFPKDLTGKTLIPEDQVPVDTAAFASANVNGAQQAECDSVIRIAFHACVVNSAANDLSRQFNRSAIGERHNFLASMLTTAPLISVTGVCIV